VSPFKGKGYHIVDRGHLSDCYVSLVGKIRPAGETAAPPLL
jgi:hypothetical protein